MIGEQLQRQMKIYDPVKKYLVIPAYKFYSIHLTKKNIQFNNL
jgi:hypothetical protein